MRLMFSTMRRLPNVTEKLNKKWQTKIKQKAMIKSVLHVCPPYTSSLWRDKLPERFYQNLGFVNNVTLLGWLIVGKSEI